MASNARKLARHLERVLLYQKQSDEQKLDKLNRMSDGVERTAPAHIKSKIQNETLKKIKDITSKEYKLQVKEGKNPTALSLFNEIDLKVLANFHRLGLIDTDILNTIQDGINGLK